MPDKPHVQGEVMILLIFITCPGFIDIVLQKIVNCLSGLSPRIPGLWQLLLFGKFRRVAQDFLRAPSAHLESGTEPRKHGISPQNLR